MRLQDIDKTNLILESYRMEGIRIEECRSIFLDWALKLPAKSDPQEAIEFLLKTYSENGPDHPMTLVLTEGLGTATKTGRRGGRRARVGG